MQPDNLESLLKLAKNKIKQKNPTAKKTFRTPRPILLVWSQILTDLKKTIYFAMATYIC